MIQSLDIPVCEDLAELSWDPEEVRDLIRTTLLRFDDDGISVGCEAEQLFGLEGATLAGCFI